MRPKFKKQLLEYVEKKRTEGYGADVKPVINVISFIKGGKVVKSFQGKEAKEVIKEIQLHADSFEISVEEAAIHLSETYL